MLTCSVCGGSEFSSERILWAELIAEWQLSREEENYVNEQQGRKCNSCGANMRAIALGNALRDAWSSNLTIKEYVLTEQARALNVLDINGAPAISDALMQLPGYVRADYPIVDIQSLPYSDGSFDLVLHSDTLEHVSNPIRALEECRRVLAAGARLCFTVPVIIGRMTRSRTGLAASYHGAPGSQCDDYIVHTEFGADVWTLVARAGFPQVMINHVDFPVATAISAWCPART